MAADRANDLQAFLRFAEGKLANGRPDLTLDEAPGLWEYENTPEDEREATLQAIRQGLEDMYAGRTRPIEEFDREFRQRHGLPHRS